MCWYFGTKSQVNHYRIIQTQIKVKPVVGYAEKNEPRTLETPRPNSCPKISGRKVTMYFYSTKQKPPFFPVTTINTYSPI